MSRLATSERSLWSYLVLYYGDIYVTTVYPVEFETIRDANPTIASVSFLEYTKQVTVFHFLPSAGRKSSYIDVKYL